MLRKKTSRDDIIIMTTCPTDSLTSETLRRYARHLVLPSFGEEAQRKLLGASVVMVGAGGLGASCLSYLAAAGIGHIGIIDADSVELSNLNRQIIHETGDIGRPKALSATDRISELNPDCEVTPHLTRLGTENALELLSKYDLVIDGSDNFETRYVINDACMQLRTPWVYAAVRGWHAQMSSFRPDISIEDVCYRCLVPEAPPLRLNCEEGGIIGPLVGTVGTLQALEAIRILTGIGTTMHGTLHRYDALNNQWKISTLGRDEQCHHTLRP
jgi:molybdopterin/thiamine biosynthesis adenylyltransferase